MASIDLIDTAATVRLELDDWTGHRFTDLFTLLKVDGEWKIMSKVFHLYAGQQTKMNTL
ncbi:MAG: nuclear transport factor 2 family protein [Deltaproteobacteria bacterium]|nr:nuclear transport factor 2 family protein [Deltaproteobacteria bacterium]